MTSVDSIRHSTILQLISIDRKRASGRVAGLVAQSPHTHRRYNKNRLEVIVLKLALPCNRFITGTVGNSLRYQDRLCPFFVSDHRTCSLVFLAASFHRLSSSIFDLLKIAAAAAVVVEQSYRNGGRLRFLHRFI